MESSTSLWLVMSQVFAVSGLRFIAIGDWGVTEAGKDNLPKQRQTQVAKAMARWATDHGPLDFIISTGDNFYPRGITSANSERFKTTWRNVYNFTSLHNVPWFISIGNHDYTKEPRDGELYQVAAHGSFNNTWIFPHLWYSKTFPADGSQLHVIVIDSMALHAKKYFPTQQIHWLKNQLSTSEAEWKILVAHHPVYCLGNNGPLDKTMLEEIYPLLDSYGVDILLTGHDHALEHIRRIDQTGTDLVISGAGGKEPYREKNYTRKYLQRKGLQTLLYAEDNGFVSFKISAHHMQVEFYNRMYKQIHRFERWKGTGYRQMRSLDAI